MLICFFSCAHSHIFSYKQKVYPDNWYFLIFLPNSSRLKVWPIFLSCGWRYISHGIIMKETHERCLPSQAQAQENSIRRLEASITQSSMVFMPTWTDLEQVLPKVFWARNKLSHFGPLERNKSLKWSKIHLWVGHIWFPGGTTKNQAQLTTCLGSLVGAVVCCLPCGWKSQDWLEW